MAKNFWFTDHTLEVVSEGKTFHVHFQRYQGGKNDQFRRINVQFSARDVAAIALQYKKDIKVNKNGRIRVSCNPCNSSVEIELENIATSVFPNLGTSVATSRSVDEIWGNTTDYGIMLTFPVDYTSGNDPNFYTNPLFVEDLDLLYYKDYAEKS